MMIVGIFSSRRKLQIGIDVAKLAGDSKVYWAKVELNFFDSLLPNFWTMHYEKLNEVIF
jgi:hypothetical protein